MKNNNKRLIIKVCGMRDEENIKAVSALDIDMMGFIFYPKSPRYVSQISSRAGIIPDYSQERIEQLTKKSTNANCDHQPLRVGVFVDDMPQITKDTHEEITKRFNDLYNKLTGAPDNSTGAAENTDVSVTTTM